MEPLLSPDRLRIPDAVILMAGSGSRLRAPERLAPKPLIPLLEKPLVCYVLDCLVQAGVTNVYAVVGFESERVVAALGLLVPESINFHPIKNTNWRRQNGISLLAAQRHVTGPFLLTMADHLFEYSLIDTLLRSADPHQLNLAVDRKLELVFDLDDAMKVKTKGDRIVTIGKDLRDYDAIDTGLFVCPRRVFDFLERAKRDGDCSLADGVRLMAMEGQARAIDIGNGWWQDVDTPEMLARAEHELSRRAADGAFGQTLCRQS
jgi:1L-myo-inositol 1-phosphate cytidylyltransferase